MAETSGHKAFRTNGIEVSDDLHHMFVADSGSATVFRYNLDAMDKPPTAIKPGFRTDNIRWTSGGKLLLAGTQADPDCKPASQSCPKTLVVKTLDLHTGVLTTLFRMPASPAFSNVSSALMVNGHLSS